MLENGGLGVSPETMVLGVELSMVDVGNVFVTLCGALKAVELAA